MTDPRPLEDLLRDAIALLSDSGFPFAAEALRDNLRSIREAPTAGARRHRIFQLRDLFGGAGAAFDVFFWVPSERGGGFRFRPTEAQRGFERRYRRTLASIQKILSGADAA